MASKKGRNKKMISSKFLNITKQVSDKLNDRLNIVFLGLGQAGGRMAAEFSSIFGYTAFAINSNQADTEEIKHDVQDILIMKSDKHKHGGAGKVASVGLDIAKENSKALQDFILRSEIQQADFVYVCVGLGGGTGNGSLPLINHLLTRTRKRTSTGNPTFGVIASIPERADHWSVRQNAMGGFAQIEKLIQSKGIGSIIPVDLERLSSSYYNSHLDNGVSAYDYANQTVANLLYEICVLPLLGGSKVLDNTELVEILSKPGYLSIARKEFSSTDLVEMDYTDFIVDAFKENEVLTSGYQLDRTQIGAIFTIQGSENSLTSAERDRLESETKKVMKYQKVHSGAATVKGLDDNLLYLVANVEQYPDSIRLMFEETQNEIKLEEQRKAQRQKELEERNSIFNGLDDVFTLKTTSDVVSDNDDLLSGFDLGSDETPETNAPVDLFEDFKLDED